MQSNTTRIGMLLLGILFISTSSCKKFLATYSQNYSFIENAEDLDELLVGEGYVDYLTSLNLGMLHVMDDDLAAMIPHQAFSSRTDSKGFHYWQAQPRINTDGQLSVTDDFFNNAYIRIARINSILHHVPLLQQKGEPTNILNRVSGEAYFLRAYYYFLLVNIYGKPFKPSTAASDFGVPLKIDPTVKDQFVSRSTTQQVYDQIITDLLLAEKMLAGSTTNQSSSSIRASRAAAQALLSRVYMYTEDYESAVYYADQVINKGAYDLMNLNAYRPGENFLDKNSSEVIFTMGTNYPLVHLMGLEYDIPSTPTYKASDNLMLGYSPEDLRLQVYYHRNSRGEMRVAKRKKTTSPAMEDVSDVFLLRLSELFLNKAEALAALDRFEEARSTLQEFRKTRFRPSELPAVNATGPALIHTIRDERRLELCLEAHRWFDLRRYAVNSKYPFSKSIIHRSVVFGGNGYVDNGYYELGTYEQDAAAYIVPIANDEIEFNNGLLKNEPRPDRPLKQ